MIKSFRKLLGFALVGAMLATVVPTFASAAPGQKKGAKKKGGKKGGGKSGKKGTSKSL